MDSNEGQPIRAEEWENFVSEHATTMIAIPASTDARGCDYHDVGTLEGSAKLQEIMAAANRAADIAAEVRESQDENWGISTRVSVAPFLFALVSSTIGCKLDMRKPEDRTAFLKHIEEIVRYQSVSCNPQGRGRLNGFHP